MWRPPCVTCACRPLSGRLSGSGPRPGRLHPACRACCRTCRRCLTWHRSSAPRRNEPVRSTCRRSSTRACSSASLPSGTLLRYRPVHPSPSLQVERALRAWSMRVLSGSRIHNHRAFLHSRLHPRPHPLGRRSGTRGACGCAGFPPYFPFLLGTGRVSPRRGAAHEACQPLADRDAPLACRQSQTARKACRCRAHRRVAGDPRRGRQRAPLSARRAAGAAEPRGGDCEGARGHRGGDAHPRPGAEAPRAGGPAGRPPVGGRPAPPCPAGGAGASGGARARASPPPGGPERPGEGQRNPARQHDGGGCAPGGQGWVGGRKAAPAGRSAHPSARRARRWSAVGAARGRRNGKGSAPKAPPPQTTFRRHAGLHARGLRPSRRTPLTAGARRVVHLAAERGERRPGPAGRPGSALPRGGGGCAGGRALGAGRRGGGARPVVPRRRLLRHGGTERPERHRVTGSAAPPVLAVRQDAGGAARRFAPGSRSWPAPGGFASGVAAGDPSGAAGA